MFSYKRSERIGDQLRAEIADILVRKAKDPRIGLVTVTAVEVTDDLRQARVFVGLLQEGAGEKKVMAALDRASGFVRSELGKRLRLKYLPKLIFCPDLSARRAAHIEQLLEEIKDQENRDSEADS